MCVCVWTGEGRYIQSEQARLLQTINEQQKQLLHHLAQIIGGDGGGNALLAPSPEAAAASNGRYPLPAGKKYHFFISHSQVTGGDVANLLSNNLTRRGCKVWCKCRSFICVSRAATQVVNGLCRRFSATPSVCATY
eukprot:COSAG05_NODE_8777_length_672_cov_1.333333_2_plen_136_part_00